MASKTYVVLTLAFHKEGKHWLGECLELGTATFGRTLEQVHAELVEMVEMNLEGLQELGELEHFFAKWNIPLYTDEVPPPALLGVPVREERFLRIHAFTLAQAA